MKKILSTFLFCLASTLSLNALANECIKISNQYVGKWKFQYGEKIETIEFIKDSPLILLDNQAKQLNMCVFFPTLNRASFSFKEDMFSYYNLELNKTGNQLIRLGTKSTLLVKVVDEAVEDKPIDTVVSVNSDNSVPAFTSFGWESIVAYDGHIFPSWLVSMATIKSDGISAVEKNLPKNVEFMGDILGMYGVGIKNIKENTNIKIEIDLGPMASLTVYEAVLAKAGTVYVIKPKVNYDYQFLISMKQPTPLNAKFTLYVDGERKGESIKTLTIHSINDAPTASINKTDGSINLNPMIFAAYVNENNPTIDVILREALDTGEISSFIGYQRTAQEVHMQVYAIWNALQRRGIKYSSITTPTAVSKDIHSQYVRFFNDSLSSSQANCVDGTVLFASILRRVGINPKLVLVPGHMFLAYDLDKNGQQVAFLETTMIGNVDLGANVKTLDDKLSKALRMRSVKNTNSYNSFINATNEGRRQAVSHWPKIKAGNDLAYMMIDIEVARAAGIAPINH